MAKLAAYRAKRNFDRTAEPPGRVSRSKSGAGIFVVQKHAARRLHYDLRLELDGVMKSWAVAKGPSLIAGDKRLAVHVEDHPVAYNSFEGTIPKGQYGGGTVLLWDRGGWVPLEDPHKGYAKGHLVFRLEGEKLRGAFDLVRMKAKPGEKRENWLLIKKEDETARGPDGPDILEEEPRSVESGRTIEEIAADPDSRSWDSSKGEAAETRARKAPAKAGATTGRPPPPDLAALVEGTPEQAFPKDIEPCLAALADVVPASDRWLHEIKWDGYRLLAFKDGRSVRLATRRGLDWTERFPAIAEAIRALPVATIVLDGEAVVEDEQGVPRFAALQEALSGPDGNAAGSAILYCFDLLHLEGHDLRGLPLEERKARLAALVPPGTGVLRLSEHLDADGPAMAKSARAMGLEGIVSKRRDRPYRSGRGEDWVKTKFSDRQEFAISGYVPSSADAKAVGSLVLAYHDGPALVLAGRAGTGFTARIARALFERLAPLRRKATPLTQRPTTEEKRGVAWVEPDLVAEIEFRGWTGDQRLRHAAFKGLREDKPGEDVVRERPEGPKKPAKGPERSAEAEGTAAPGEIAGVRLTHPDRVFWPESGITKQGLAEYYEEIADWLLPHIRERPLSLVRCPEGIAGSCFFQKHAWAGISDHIELRTVANDEGAEEEILFVRDLPGVIALVQSSVLEIHPWGTTIADLDHADRITMDLDPGEETDWADIVAAAVEMRERLSRSGLDSFLKTTGGKGLHVVAPLRGAAPWPAVKAFAKSLADRMEADDPGRYVAKASKEARRGRVFVDYLRNGRGATAVAAYSSRARAGATVALPIGWDALTPSLRPGQFTVETVPARLHGAGQDPWAGIASLRQGLPQVPPKPGSRRAPGRKS